MKSSVKFVKEIFSDVQSNFDKNIEVIYSDSIPNQESFKLEVQKWYQVNNVICVYVDLASSTKINIQEKKDLAAHIFDSYIKAVTKIFTEYQSKYIDIQGDGGFALFDGENSINRALVAAVTIKTLLSRQAQYFSEFVNSKLNNTNLSVRIGIHKGNILAKKSGIRGENEIIWLGDAVSVASKICNLKFYENNQFQSDTIRVSNTAYEGIKNRHLIDSCKCGEIVNLWECYKFEKLFYGISALYVLKSNWCERCGDSFSENALENIPR